MFVVDANTLIEAKNRYYAFDIAPGFWAWLEQTFATGAACSIRPVLDEILQGADELAEWAKTRKQYFHALDQASIAQFPLISAWAQTRVYSPAALAEFAASRADFQLIAFARAYSHVLVTHEVPSPDARKKVKIPDACLALGVSYENTFAMLRRTGAQLQLG